MKKAILLLLLCLPAVLVAQNHYIGLKLGANFSDVQSSEGSTQDFTEARIGIVGGITYEYSLLSFLRLGAEFMYTQKGHTLQLTFSDQFGNALGSGEILIRNDYITIPVKAGVSLGRRLSFVGYFGVAPAFLVRADADSENLTSGSVTEDRTDVVNSFDISGLIDLGLSLKLGRFIIYLTGGYEHSFSNYNDNPNSDTKLRNAGFNATLGGRFALKK